MMFFQNAKLLNVHRAIIIVFHLAEFIYISMDMNYLLFYQYSTPRNGKIPTTKVTDNPAG